jgi:NTP pyrophosphatase (non-canonical NTP hydrolase)
MQMNEYQQQASSTAVYPGKGSILGLAYVGLGLGEAGEVQGKIKKILRDNNGVVEDQHRIAIAKELGDVLWYVAMASEEIGIPLEVIGSINLDKLADRRERGVLAGSGDER